LLFGRGRQQITLLLTRLELLQRDRNVLVADPEEASNRHDRVALLVLIDEEILDLTDLITIA
jgi:hypothetical protein